MHPASLLYPQTKCAKKQFYAHLAHVALRHALTIDNCQLTIDNSSLSLCPLVPLSPCPLVTLSLPPSCAKLPPVTKHRPLILQLVVLTLGRLFLNTGVRMVYPFLPELARGLGVSLPVLSRLITLRAFTGF